MGSVPSARFGACAAASGSMVYVFGGSGSEYNNDDDADFSPLFNGTRASVVSHA